MCINSCAGAYAKGTDMITREQTNQRKSQINRHMDFFTNKLFLIALTFIVFVLAQQLQRATGVKLLNPILVSIVVLICILMSAGVDYSTYKESGDYIDFWLKPAVVALGVPLYKQLGAIRKQMLPLLVAEMAGCVAGVDIRGACRPFPRGVTRSDNVAGA